MDQRTVIPIVKNPAALESDGVGCHAGKEQLEAAARAAGKAGVLDRYAADYPKGPHDQPQSMCPAFGSLRVGLRMRRTATILSGSACCVYGLTFTSHFYGARRSVGYVPFNSETLVTGKLFEDIRDAVHEQANPDSYDAIVVINLCVPTASGVPLQILPKEINGVRVIGIDVPGFGVPTHAEAKDVLSAAMLKYARSEVVAGPVAAPRSGVSDKPTVTLLGEMFPADPMIIGGMLEMLGLAAGPTVPTRAWRELYAALDCAAVAAIHPFYTASLREFEAAVESLNRSDLRILSMLADEMGAPINLPSVKAARKEITALGKWDGATAGMKILSPAAPISASGDEVILTSWRNLLDKGSLQEGEDNLAGTARATTAVISKQRAEKLAVKSGELIRVSNSYGAITLPCTIGDIDDQSIWLPRNSANSQLIKVLGTVGNSLVKVGKA